MTETRATAPPRAGGGDAFFPHPAIPAASPSPVPRGVTPRQVSSSLPNCPGEVSQPRRGLSGEGEPSLTPREREVVRLYALGYQAETICAQLGIGSRRTVYHHAWNARRKGADVPDLERGSPRRKVDYLVFLRELRTGSNLTEIAQRHGVTVSVVSRAIKKLREAGADVPPVKNGGLRPGAFGRPRA